MPLVPRIPTLQDSELAGTGFDWISVYVQDYALSKIVRFVVRSGKNALKARPGVWGYCRGSLELGFVISCSVKGPFPATIRQRKSAAYPKRVSFSKKKLADAQEAVVWIVAHEFYHYLYWTEQVAGSGSEIAADAFANDRLDEYREWLVAEDLDFHYSSLERMEAI